jgi:MFS family permease
MATTTQPTDSAQQAVPVSVRYEPRTKQMKKYVSAYGLASLGIGLLWGGVSSILIPLHVQSFEFAQFFTGSDSSVDLQALNDLRTQVTAGNTTPTPEQSRLLDLLAKYDAAKASGLSLVTSIGVFLTMMIQPVVGMFSDRTRSRWGRRAPWIFGGAVTGGALLFALTYAPSLIALIALWSLVQILGNVASGPLQTTVADRVPEERIGSVSALTGILGYASAIGGTVIAGSLFAAVGLAAYFPFAILLILLPSLFVLIARDKSSRDLPLAPLGLGGFFNSYAVGLKDHDFRWAWISKMLIMSGYGVSSVYSIYMLQSYISPALSIAEAAQTAPLLQLVALPATLLSMFFAGRWSDKVQRRKPFVFWAAIIIAISFLIPWLWPALPALFIQAIVSGIGLGAFLTVDQALFIDVLPDKESAGRELGLAALGGNLGMAIGPAFAGAIVGLSGGAYGPVWPAGAVAVALAALAILPIKRVN